MNKKEILNKFNQIDSYLTKQNLELELVIIGGTSFILMDLIPRSTSDIVFLNNANENIVSIISATFPDVDINNRAKQFDYKFGVDWEEDVIIYSNEFKSLKLFTLSPERLLASRFFGDKRIEDIEYIINKTLNLIDVKKFIETYNEIFEYAQHIENRVIKENQYLLRKLLNKKGVNYEKSNIKKLC